MRDGQGWRVGWRVGVTLEGTGDLGESGWGWLGGVGQGYFATRFGDVGMGEGCNWV